MIERFELVLDPVKMNINVIIGGQSARKAPKYICFYKLWFDFELAAIHVLLFRLPAKNGMAIFYTHTTDPNLLILC